MCVQLEETFLLTMKTFVTTLSYLSTSATSRADPTNQLIKRRASVRWAAIGAALQLQATYRARSADSAALPVFGRSRRSPHRLWRHGRAAAGAGGEQEAVRVCAVVQLGAHRGAAQREGPRLRARRRRRHQGAGLPRHQPLGSGPGVPGRRRHPLRVARHQPVHRDQVPVLGPGPAAGDAVGEAGGVAGGGVAPLLPGRGRPGVRDPRQATAARRRAARPGSRGRARPQGGRRARRLRRAPRRGEQVPHRRPVHAGRREPHGAAVRHEPDPPRGGAGRCQAARAGVVGRDLRPPRLEEDRRRAPPPAGVRTPVAVCGIKVYNVFSRSR